MSAGRRCYGRSGVLRVPCRRAILVSPADHMLLAQVEAAGGTLTAPAHMRPDPDGHLFQIAWNSDE